MKSMARLAIDGGPRAFARASGRPKPKIGVEEFMSLAERFGFTAEALARLRQAVSDDDLRGNGPNLARYACPFPDDVPPKGVQLEELACRKLGVRHALAVSSGTAALHAAFVAAGVGPGTEVICPGLGFMATAMAVMMSGGVPVFCDVDESLQLDPARVEECITPRTVALAPTHHWGNVADMEPILGVARRHGLRVVEDCAQAPGARYQGRYVGTLGDLGCYSISCYKIVGGGEGGMVVADDDRLFDRACQLAEGGGLWRPDRFAPPRYEGELFPGTNYRMGEMEAAVDLVQLGKLDEVCDRYRRASRRILSRLGTYRQVRPQTLNDAQGFIGYQLRFFPESFALSRRIAEALRAEGIPVSHRGRHHRPDWHLSQFMYPVVLPGGHTAGGSVYEDPRWLQRGGKVQRPACPVAKDLYAREVAVHVNQWWTERDCDRVAGGIDKVLAAYCSQDASAKPWL